jgi:hypothetical protein
MSAFIASVAYIYAPSAYWTQYSMVVVSFAWMLWGTNLASRPRKTLRHFVHCRDRFERWRLNVMLRVIRSFACLRIIAAIDSLTPIGSRFVARPRWESCQPSASILAVFNGSRICRRNKESRSSALPVRCEGLDLILGVPCLLISRQSHTASSATIALEQGQGRIGETNLAELVEGAYCAIGHLVADPLR